MLKALLKTTVGLAFGFQKIIFLWFVTFFSKVHGVFLSPPLFWELDLGDENLAGVKFHLKQWLWGGVDALQGSQAYSSGTQGLHALALAVFIPGEEWGRLQRPVASRVLLPVGLGIGRDLNHNNQEGKI